MTPTFRRHARRASRAAGLLIAAACAVAPPPAEPTACPPLGPRSATPLPFAIAGDAERGARLFDEHCQGCHAPAAALRRPDAPVHAPRLDCAAWLAAVDESYLYQAINRGPGLFGHAGAAPLGEHLSPTEVADLVAHLHSLAER